MRGAGGASCRCPGRHAVSAAGTAPPWGTEPLHRRYASISFALVGVSRRQASWTLAQAGYRSSTPSPTLTSSTPGPMCTMRSQPRPAVVQRLAQQAQDASVCEAHLTDFVSVPLGRIGGRNGLPWPGGLPRRPRRSRHRVRYPTGPTPGESPGWTEVLANPTRHREPQPHPLPLPLPGPRRRPAAGPPRSAAAPVSESAKGTVRPHVPTPTLGPATIHPHPVTR